jgi:hypothetical protein
LPRTWWWVFGIDALARRWIDWLLCAGRLQWAWIRRILNRIQPEGMSRVLAMLLMISSSKSTGTPPMPKKTGVMADSPPLIQPLEAQA